MLRPSPVPRAQGSFRRGPLSCHCLPVRTRLPSSYPMSSPDSTPPVSEIPAVREPSLDEVREQLLTDPGAAPTAVRAYFQGHNHAAAVLKEWQIGFLPPSLAASPTYAILQRRVIFPVRSLTGALLALAGRDPAYGPAQAAPSSDDPETPPPSSQWAIVPPAPQALFGENRLTKRGAKAKLKKAGGLFLVQEPEDVIRLARADILAVASFGTQTTPEQRQQLHALARDQADARIVLMNALDLPGRVAMLQTLRQLCTKVAVRVAWTSSLQEGRFRDKSPAVLTDEELAALKDHWS